MDPGKLLRSFGYAFEGLKHALLTQQNMQVHFFSAFAALLLAVLFELPKTELLFILLSVTLVIVTELINTAIEHAVDLAMPERHPLAKIAKDVAAAAVLVSAAFAAVTAMVVFYTPIAELIRSGRTQDQEPGPALVWVLVAFVALVVTVLQASLARSRSALRPSLMTAVSFAMAVWVALLAGQPLASLLALAMALQLLLVLGAGRRVPWGSLWGGAVLGSGITLAAYGLIQTL